MKKRIIKADDERLFVVAEAIRQGVTNREKFIEWCEMDFFFLQKVEKIVNMERRSKSECRKYGSITICERNGLQ